MKIAVINSRVYSNPYQRLLYSAIGHRYQITSGSINEAIRQQRTTKRTLYHIHWEEAQFSLCNTTAEAVRLRRSFIARLKRYVAIGGKVVWTIHNAKPHEGVFVKTLFSLRKELVSIAHRILVHNEAALIALKKQTGITDFSKVKVLPHPSYFDVYESTERTRKLVGETPRHSRTLLHFGMVRAYKGLPDLVRKLSPDFMAKHQLTLNICGQPHRAESFLSDLLADTQYRTDITYNLDSVPTECVADLLRSHAGLIIPYHNVLTSGVAVLSLTLGVPAVAPNTLAMRELYPKSAHQLLFNPRSPNDLRRAVLELVEMPSAVRIRVSQDYIDQAFKIHPQVISKALGMIYDDLLELSYRSDGATILEIGHQNGPQHEAMARFRMPPIFQIILEGMIMATSKAAASELSNQQLALELVKVTLLGNAARSTASDELILNNTKKDVNKFINERARLDGAYAVKLYQNILGRLAPAVDKEIDSATGGMK